jgi:hypothetical protein
MENLNDDILNKIYYYKHNLEMKAVLDELIQARIYTQFKVSLAFCLISTYTYNGERHKCIDIDNISCSSYDLLTVIKHSSYYYKLF